MSIYQIVIGERSYRVDISGDELSINGERENADLIALNNAGLYLLRMGSRNVELYIQSCGRRLYEITSEGGRRLIARVERYLGNPIQAVDTRRAGALLAPMSGRVMACHAAPGDQVEQGQVLVTLESMKMQMELRAPAAGRVEKIAVEPGAQVEKGTLLVQVDPQEGESGLS